jgi:hypothetical protein
MYLSSLAVEARRPVLLGPRAYVQPRVERVQRVNEDIFPFRTYLTVPAIHGNGFQDDQG